MQGEISDAEAGNDYVAPELGRHLQMSVKTGVYCSYSPEHPPTWAVERNDR